MVRVKHMKAGEIRRRIAYERKMALDIRDPIAIRHAGERYDLVMKLLEGIPDDATVDLDSITLSVSQAAQALGYNPKQLRKLIHEGRVRAKKQNDQWRISLKTVL